MMHSDSVKKSVVDSYSKLAKSASSGRFSKLFACCSPGDNVKQVGKIIGYSDQEMDSVPTGSNMGVGCGNPAAFDKIQLGEIIIDLGSGAGFDAFNIAPLVGDQGKVIGVDLSEEMLKLAIKNSKQGNYKNIEFIKGDIEALPLESSIADRVISNCVINLSLNKDKVYQEAYRVLKPGGKIAISDIVLERPLPDFIKNALGGHIACVSGAEKLDDYIQYIKDAGFKSIVIESKVEFPLELMLADPMVMKLANSLNFNLDTEEAKDIASRVKSISITAIK